MKLFQKKLNPKIQHYNNTAPLSEWRPDLEEDYCFYYNWIDQLYGFTFADFLTEEHINFLKCNSNIKVIYDFNGEPILENLLLDVIKTSEKWSLNDEQIILIVSNQLQTEFVNQRCKITKIIKTFEWNYDIQTTLTPSVIKNLQTKKFSVTCRLHRPWRSYLLCRLKQEKLLENFYFSFMGCENDMEAAFDKVKNNNTDISIILANGDWAIIPKPEKIKKDLYNKCGLEIDKELEKFINECPHFIEKDKFKSDVETPQEIYFSQVHLVVENGFFDLKESEYTVRSFEMGEKTWKAIIAGKPFLVYSDAGYLQQLRKCGFETFNPYINESYDLESDCKVRAEKIISEIKRINNLSINDFKNLLDQCYDKCQHNLNLYEKIKREQPNFKEINFNKL